MFISGVMIFLLLGIRTGFSALVGICCPSSQFFELVYRTDRALNLMVTYAINTGLATRYLLSILLSACVFNCLSLLAVASLIAVSNGTHMLSFSKPLPLSCSSGATLITRISCIKASVP